MIRKKRNDLAAYLHDMPGLKYQLLCPSDFTIIMQNTCGNVCIEVLLISVAGLHACFLFFFPTTVDL